MRRSPRTRVAFADVIVLNKTDLVSRQACPKSRRRIRGINPYGQTAVAPERCRSRLSDVLERGAFDLDRISSWSRNFSKP